MMQKAKIIFDESNCKNLRFIQTRRIIGILGIPTLILVVILFIYVILTQQMSAMNIIGFGGFCLFLLWSIIIIVRFNHLRVFEDAVQFPDKFVYEGTINSFEKLYKIYKKILLLKSFKAILKREKDIVPFSMMTKVLRHPPKREPSLYTSFMALTNDGRIHTISWMFVHDVEKLAHILKEKCNEYGIDYCETW